MIYDFLSKIKPIDDDSDNGNQFVNLPQPDLEASKEWLNEEKQIKPQLGQQTVLENELPEQPIQDSELSEVSQEKVFPISQENINKYLKPDKTQQTSKSSDYLSLLNKAIEDDKEQKKHLMMLNAAQRMGAGLARIKPDYESIDRMQKLMPSSVDELNKKMEMQEKVKKIQDDEQLDDPNSAASQFLRDQLRQFTGKEPDPRLTGRVLIKQLGIDADKINQFITTKESKQQALQQHKEETAQKLEEKRREFNQNYEAKLANIKMMEQMYGATAETKKMYLDLAKEKEKNDQAYKQEVLTLNREKLQASAKEHAEKDEEKKLKRQSDAKTKFDTAIDYRNKRMGASGEAANVYDRSERIIAMFNNLKTDAKGNIDFGSATALEKEELIKSIDMIISGRSTISGAKEMRESAKTLNDKLANIKQHLMTDGLVPLNQSTIIKKLHDTIKRERSISGLRLAKTAASTAKNHPDVSDEDKAESIWEKYNVEPNEQYLMIKHKLEPNDIMTLRDRKIDLKDVIAQLDSGKKLDKIIPNKGITNVEPSQNELTYLKAAYASKGHNLSDDQIKATIAQHPEILDKIRKGKNNGPK
jgi:hypothetical protein